MANITIAQLPSASALTGTEVLPVVQSGITKKTTVQDIANLAGGGGGGFGTLDVTTVGTFGQNVNVQYALASVVSGSNTGAQQYPLEAIPNINLYNGGYGGGVPTLSFIEFPTVTRVSYFTINGYPYLETVNVPELAYAESIGLNNLPVATTFNFLKLIKVTSNINIGSYTPGTINTINFPLLQEANFNFQSSYSNLTNKINSTNFPSLTTFHAYISGVNDLGEVSLPTVTTIGNQGLVVNTGNYGTTKLDLPNIVTFNSSNIYVNSNYGLTYVRFGTPGITKNFNTGGNNPNINFQSCALDQASVDNILTTMASLDGTNGTTASYYGSLYINGGSNAVPSQVGLDAITVLQNRGWNIGRNY